MILNKKQYAWWKITSSHLKRIHSDIPLPGHILVFFLEKPKLSSVFVFFGASVAPMRQFCPLLKKRKTMYKFRKKQSALVLIWPTDDSWHTRREKCALNPVIPKILPKFPQIMEFWELLRQVISGDVISIRACKNRF